MPHIHTCPCCTPPTSMPPRTLAPRTLAPRTLARRGMFGLAAGLATAAMLPRTARAADGTAYDSMLLTCIDPRLVSPVNA